MGNVAVCCTNIIQNEVIKEKDEKLSEYFPVGNESNIWNVGIESSTK